MLVARSRPRSKVRFALRALGIASIALVAIALIRWQAVLNWAGNYLVCSDPLERADLVLVMGGDFWGPRVTTAAQLGTRGLAPLVLISGPPYMVQPENIWEPEGKLAIDLLVRQGYPRSLFAVFAHNEHSTLSEVLALRGELARRHPRRVIVVTSSFHSRRCIILFRLFCPGIHFLSAPAEDVHYRPNEWWLDASSRHLFFSEWTKIWGSILIAYPAERISHLKNAWD